MTTEQQEAAMTPIPEQEAAEVVACCGCFEGGKNSESNNNNHYKKTSKRSTVLYKDAAGKVLELDQFEVDELLDAKKSTEFFDALETAGDDDDSGDLYPIMTSAVPPTFHRELSLDIPNTMLRRTGTAGFRHFRRSLIGLNLLTEPEVAVEERGFPGSLTRDELEQCMRLVKELKTRDKLFTDFLFPFSEFEDDAYALCRWLRGNKFSVDEILMKLEERKDIFLTAQKASFYPDIEETLGVPMGAWLKWYPSITHGFAKNGCPVIYVRAGQLKPEAFMCLGAVEDFLKFGWYHMMVRLKGQLKLAREKNPHFVRLQGITVIDLEGMNYGTCMSSEIMNVVKLGSKLGDCFPETCHCNFVVNAPSFFTISWGIFKRMLKPRTVKRVQVFSSREKGNARLKDMIDESQLPSDYGGSGPSLDSVVESTSGPENAPKRDRNIESYWVVLKINETKTVTFHVAEGKTMTISAHTRSASSAKVTVVDKMKQCTIFEEAIGGTKKEDADFFLPRRVTIGKDLVGPGSFEVSVQDLNDAKVSGVSRGNFIFVADSVVPSLMD